MLSSTNCQKTTKQFELILWKLELVILYHQLGRDWLAILLLASLLSWASFSFLLLSIHLIVTSQMEHFLKEYLLAELAHSEVHPLVY